MLEQAVVNVFGIEKPNELDLTLLFREIDRNEDFDDLPSSTAERTQLSNYVIERQRSTDSFGRMNIRYSVQDLDSESEVQGYEFYVFDEQVQSKFTIKKPSKWIPDFLIKIFSITYQEEYQTP